MKIETTGETRTSQRTTPVESRAAPGNEQPAAHRPAKASIATGALTSPHAHTLPTAPAPASEPSAVDLPIARTSEATSGATGRKTVGGGFSPSTCHLFRSGRNTRHLDENRDHPGSEKRVSEPPLSNLGRPRGNEQPAAHRPAKASIATGALASPHAHTLPTAPAPAFEPAAVELSATSHERSDRLATMRAGTRAYRAAYRRHRSAASRAARSRPTAAASESLRCRDVTRS